MRRVLRGAFGFAFRVALIVFGLTILYAHFLVERLDVSRSSLAARARSVEANVVPSRVAGPAGRNFDAALELPLSLPPERIPDFVKNAFIAQEDQQFRSWWHFGINPVTLAGAVRAYVSEPESSGKLRGASTITMQLVKNLLLHQEQTLDRKINEAILAVIVEIMFSKDEILAMYLNTAYFGDGAYGIETAARRFFGRSVGYAPKVNMLEAAMLASSVKRPSQINPSSRRAHLEKKARALIAAMAEEGYETGEGRQARARGGRSWSLNPYLFRDVAMRFMVPRELRDRDDTVVMGFTIDTEAQLYAEMAAVDLLNRGRSAGYDSSAIIVLEPDGALVALATGHDYDGVDIVRNGRVSPGSALKPFMALCALEHGMRPDSPVADRRKEFRPGWVVQNFDGRFLGRISLEVALARSRNPPAVELFDRFGPKCFDDVLRRVGIRLADAGSPTAVLGSQHVPLLDLAAAYAGLANGGVRVEPYAVRYARRRDGEVIYRHMPPLDRKRITADQPYCDLMHMLRKVTSAQGTGHNAAFAHPAWGKTGTSSRHRDALFAGFTAHYVAVVWLGRQALGDVTGRVTGGELPAETFRWLMSTLHEGKPVADIPCVLQVAGAVPATETR